MADGLKYITEIRTYFALFTTEIRLASNSGYHDINLYAEILFIPIMNALFTTEKASFKRLEIDKKNTEAIDLGCQNSKIAFQITSTKSALKIKNTLEKFIKKELYKNYDRLYILIIDDEYKSSLKTTDLNEYLKEISNKNNKDLGNFKFESSHIWNISTLVNEIGNHLDIDSLFNIHEYLGKEYPKLKFNQDISSEDLIFIQSLNKKLQEISNIKDAFNYLFNKFEELKVIPHTFLSKLYPLSKTNNSKSHYSDFSLYTDNKDLYNYFKELIKKDISELDETNKKIVDFFGHNLFHHLYLFNSNEERLCIHTLFSREQCNCVRCTFERFDFTQSINKLIGTNKNQENYDALKNAYMHYQYGNFKTSILLYKELREKFKAEKKYVSYFICEHNLFRLNTIIKRYGYGKEWEKIKEGLNDIDLDKILHHLKSIQNIEPEICTVLDWIADSKFIDKTIWKILKLIDECREIYINDQNGNWSNNNSLNELLDTVAQLSLFIDGNLIIYDIFLEFTTVIQKGFEGIVALYSISNEDSSKEEFFNEYILRLIIKFGEPEKILKILESYNLKELKLSPPSHGNNVEVFNKMKNFFTSFNILEDLINEQISQSQIYYLRDKTNKLVSNQILILSRLNISTNELNQILSNVIEQLLKSSTLNSRTINYVNELLKFKGEQINIKNLEQILNLSLNKEQLKNNFTLFQHCTYWLQQKNYEITSEGILKNIDLLIDSLSTNKRILKEDNLLYFHRIAPLDYKEKIRAGILKRLNENFEHDLYYDSVLFEIINYEQYFNQYMSLIQNFWHTKGYIFSKDDKQDQNFILNHFIRLIYSYNVTLSTVEISSLHNNVPYYEWLLNLDTFDYNKFNPYWIMEYPSETYYLTFKKHPILINKVKEALEEKYIEGLAKIFIKYLA